MVTSEQDYPIVEIAELETASCSTTTAGRGRWIVRLLWLGAACSVAGLGLFASFGWDSRDYLLAIHQYESYVSGQQSSSLAYSPLFMIPTVGVARLLPIWIVIALFSVTYVGGWLAQLWVGMQCATPDERKILRYVAPVIAFFPGLLVSDVIVSGNIAYVLYGLMLISAAWGWKRGQWNWFYLAVLAAACVKVQLLTMLAIPLLCGRRQWTRSVLTGAFGISLYALQSRIWPQAFQIYMNTLKLMSQSRRDFGCGPAGNFARLLQSRGLHYEKPCIVFYLVYAAALLLVLVSLSRLYREHRVSFLSWAPVMLLGVVLLNPRILTYDIAAVTLPMVLVVWRSLRGTELKPRKSILIGAGILLLSLNVFAEVNEDVVTLLPDAWKYIEMCIMLTVFGLGVQGLWREAGVLWPARSGSYAAESYIGESFVGESDMPAFDSAD